MGWQIMPFTPYEYLESLLFFSNNEADFSEIMSQANDFIVITMSVYGLAHGHKYSSIALASLMIALEMMQFNTFKAGMNAFLSEKNLRFDLNDTKNCERKIMFHCFPMIERQVSSDVSSEEDDDESESEYFSSPNINSLNESLQSQFSTFGDRAVDVAQHLPQTEVTALACVRSQLSYNNFNSISSQSPITFAMRSR